MNLIQRLKKNKPRVWAVIVFPAFIFATLVLFPIEVLINCTIELYHDTVRTFREFFRDLYWDCKYANREGVYIIKWAWKDWTHIVRTGKGLKDEKENDGTEEA